MPLRSSAPPRALLRSFDALATAILPPGGAAGRGGAGCADALAGCWPSLQPRARAALAAMLVTVELAAVARTGRRLAALPAPRRTALCDHLERAASTVPRGAFLGAKTFVLVLAAADADVERATGVAGWPPNLIRREVRR